jgi:hypothetical protein
MSMTQRERDREIFSYAKSYLLQLDKRIPAVLDKYLVPEPPRPGTLAGIFEAILESAKNANMREGVIEGGIGKIQALRPVLFNFEPAAIVTGFRTWEQVWTAIERDLKPKGELRMGKQSIWPLFCKTILSAANFLSRFRTAADFYHWADLFTSDSKARVALPIILAEQIEGIGFALACDFIKEAGYEQYGKPDVQLMDIFVDIGLSAVRDQFVVFDDILRVAKNTRETPYCVDKIFWLIGSGKFYQDGFKIASNKEEFARNAVAKFGRGLASAAGA